MGQIIETEDGKEIVTAVDGQGAYTGKTKTMKLNIGKLIADPSNIKVKCLKFWYKS